MDFGNPWGNTQVNDAIQSSGQTMQNNVDQLQAKANSYSAQGSTYPAMQNSFGLGASTQPAVAGAQSNPNYLSTPINNGGNDGNSRGFNPWSLTGEALSRG